jgi:GTPase SAR1 family protein
MHCHWNGFENYSSKTQRLAVVKQHSCKESIPMYIQKKFQGFLFFKFIFSSYILNLDPAVNDVPYNVNIDIRDTVNYKKVMKEYNLGPNGGILTSLNLFATRFGILLKTQHLDQVITLIEKKDVEYTFVDTPVIFTKTEIRDKLKFSLGQQGLNFC